ncbi:MAG: outer membrane lipoprotein-sorting protein, partial [Desulfobacterales bacterium]|nr:outer membrane lipoprotein-sorting protein [Desulfobacterales bacterium]
LLIILSLSPRGEAFVPQTPHLLHLVVQKIKTPTGMVVYQTRQIATDEGLDASEPVTERLTYAFPSGLRADISSENSTAFTLQSGHRFVRVENGRVAATVRPIADFYTDPMLLRDYAMMAAQLAAVGIDTEKVTFQRLDGGICFFVGQPAGDREPDSGFWVDKDTFFPVRYKVSKSGRTVDVRYRNWQRVSRTWYPMDISIQVNGQPFADIRVSRFELKPGFSADRFDVAEVLSTYPVQDGVTDDKGVRGQIDGLDKEIDDFSKLFDQ